MAVEVLRKSVVRPDTSEMEGAEVDALVEKINAALHAHGDKEGEVSVKIPSSTSLPVRQALVEKTRGAGWTSEAQLDADGEVWMFS